ncbi:MAG: GldG family protein [Bdellovibrionales bacterium]|nr:GldG family protein [Bdellovibrionales bacterium]
MTSPSQNPTPKSNGPIFAVLTLVFGLGALVVRTAYPEPAWIGYVVLAAFVVCLGLLVWSVRAMVSKRTAMFGLNSAMIAILVLGILGVVNFLGVKYNKKFDLTKTGVNTLSDQSVKVFKSLTQPVKLVLWSKLDEREKQRPLLDNLKNLSSKVEIEYVDPVKEITRAKQAGIKAETTLQLFVGERSQLIEAPNEEKVTNAVIKLSKNTTPVVCAISEHGERDFEANTPDGYSLAKGTLEKQSYAVKKVNLVAEGKIPADCSLIAIIGPTKAFFEPEVKLVRDYLANGGAAVVALDLNLKGPNFDASPEITKLLTEWGVESDLAIVVDPVSQMLRLEATVPIIPTFSKDVSITKDMTGNTVFPLTRPLRIAAKTEPSLKVSWLTQTTPNAWGEKDLAGLVKGVAKFEPTSDIKGPLYTALAVDGKLPNSQAKKNTRIVVFGTSLVAANQWSRFGANLDLFANAVSWVLEDESLISIRSKEEPGGTIQLSAIQGGLIRLFTVVVVPGIMIVLGIVVWLRRKKL